MAAIREPVSKVAPRSHIEKPIARGWRLRQKRVAETFATRVIRDANIRASNERRKRIDTALLVNSKG